MYSEAFGNISLTWTKSPVANIFQKTKRIFIKLTGKTAESSVAFRLDAQDKIKKELSEFYKRIDILMYQTAELHYKARVININSRASERYIDWAERENPEAFSGTLIIDSGVRGKIFQETERIFEKAYKNSACLDEVRFFVFLEAIRQMLACLMNEHKDEVAFLVSQLGNAREYLFVYFKNQASDFEPMMSDKKCLARYYSIRT